jgi:hypothetical protein
MPSDDETGAFAFTAIDDQLHAVESPAGDWTETTWWSFNVPPRGLAGWLYTQVKPNLGVSTGGAFVYEPDAWLPWELPYYGWFAHQRLPEPLDLRDVDFANGVGVRMVRPGMEYELRYRFRDHADFVADLRFKGLTAPIPHLRGAPPFTASSHYDQHGHVTGTIELHGEAIDVDCFAVRDRSWGRRPEFIGAGARRLSYVFGTVSPEEMFLVFCLPVEDGTSTLSSGYLVRDGRLCRLVAATRTEVRDPASGGIAKVQITGQDSDGRVLDVGGEAVSRMFLPSNGLCINTLLRFDVSGREAWGEDQDVWPMAQFVAARHALGDRRA